MPRRRAGGGVQKTSERPAPQAPLSRTRGNVESGSAGAAKRKEFGRRTPLEEHAEPQAPPPEEGQEGPASFSTSHKLAYIFFTTNSSTSNRITS
eukprot:gene1667-biopygen22869